MTVSELIEMLKTLPQELVVIQPKYSEYCVLDDENVVIEELCEARPDGWIQSKRPDRDTQKYLIIGE